MMFVNDVEGRRTMLTPFYSLLLATEKSPGQERKGVDYEYLSDLVVHPAFEPDAKTRVLMENAAGGAEAVKIGAKAQWVTGTLHLMEPAKDEKGRFKYNWLMMPQGLHEVRREEFLFLASVPMLVPAKSDAVANDLAGPGLKKVAGYKPPGSGEYRDVRAYFDELNRKYGGAAVRYRYAWWETPAAIATIYPLAGLVLIGGVWPTVLGLMVGMGLGRKRSAEEKVDLSKYKGDAKAKALEGRREMNESERGQLAALEAELERRLDGFGTEGAAAPAGEQVVVEKPKPGVAVLAAASAVEEKAAEEKPVKAKTFGGDFYPTEIHHEGEKNSD